MDASGYENRRSAGLSELACLLFSAHLAISATACSEPAPPTPQPRLVVLYTSCTVNRLYTGAYDPSIPFTPSFERFATRGTVFEKHHTEAGQSGIAFASLFSGVQADKHGVYKHPRKLSPELVIVPEVFAEAGYDAHSWMVQKMASSQLRYAQGVPEDQQHLDGPLQADSPQFKKVLERLKTDPEYRAFLVTNFTVTHGPYKGDLLDEFCAAYPDQCATRGSDEELEHYRKFNKDHQRILSVDTDAAIAQFGMTDHDLKRLREINELLYKADMYKLDKMFGGVVDAIDQAGLFDDSVIAFTSDHGEVLWRDNALFLWTHGYQLAPEVINVALMMSGPKAGVPVGRYNGVSRSIDVMPTLAGIAGVPVPKDYPGDGQDLAPAIRGIEKPPDLIAFSHTALLYAPLRAKRMHLMSSLFPSPDPEFMWVSARRGDDYYKLRRRADNSWYRSVYDLGRDPEERVDLYDPTSRSQQEMLEKLEAYKEKMSEAAYRIQAGGVPRAKAIEMLRSMGYID